MRPAKEIRKGAQRSSSSSIEYIDRTFSMYSSLSVEHN